MVYAQIKEKRKKYNISQTKLSLISGYSKTQISAWELNKTKPSNTQLKKMEMVLDKTIFNINNGLDDIRKKHITTSQKKSRKRIPEIINTPEEYIEKFSQNQQNNNDYSKLLKKMYKKAFSKRGKNAPKAIALFSGCGGFSLGFAAEGFDIIGHVEIEKSANRIYESNFKNSILLGEDICNISNDDIESWKEEFGNIDVIIGGPPCQGYSLAGKRDPEDMRNQLYKYYVNIVSILRPKVFVFENVRLLTSMKTRDGYLFIDLITDAFEKVGYKLIRKEINAANYGVPQSRERVVIVGIHKKINKSFVFPQEEYAEDNQRTFRDATFDLQNLESGEKSSDPLHWSVSHPKHVINWLKDVPEGCSAHENEDLSKRPPSGFNTTYKRIKWDEPCSTISTNFSMISGSRNVHPISTRALTIREATRVQSFPDEFVFCGNWGDIRKSIGNAVPPLLAKEIAKEVYLQIFAN